MADIPIATPTNAVPGVMLTPASHIRDMIKSEVDRVLGEVPAGKRGAIVAIATREGTNIALAHRTEDESWQVSAWFGKSWRTSAVTFGAEVKHTW